MPGKPKHGGKKYSPQSKKKKVKSVPPGRVAQQPVTIQTEESAPQYSAPTPSIHTPPAMVIPTAARYPFIAIELRTIGVVAGIMLAVLILLAVIL